MLTHLAPRRQISKKCWLPWHRSTATADPVGLASPTRVRDTAMRGLGERDPMGSCIALGFDRL